MHSCISPRILAWLGRETWWGGGGEWEVLQENNFPMQERGTACSIPPVEEWHDHA